MNIVAKTTGLRRYTMKNKNHYIKIECDEPMARSKGLKGPKEKSLGRCSGKCRSCIAAIGTRDGGDRKHL